MASTIIFIFMEIAILVWGFFYQCFEYADKNKEESEDSEEESPLSEKIKSNEFYSISVVEKPEQYISFITSDRDKIELEIELLSNQLKRKVWADRKELLKEKFNV